MNPTPHKKYSVRRKVRLSFLVLLAIGGLVLLGDMIYKKYVLPRPVHFTTFAPLERRIFDLDASEITNIVYTSTVDVKAYQKRVKDYARDSTIILTPRYDFETREEIEEIVDYLNSFQYSFTVPGPDYRHMNYGTESECCLAIKTKKSDLSMGMTIQENRVHIGEVWYYGDPEYFARFMNIEAKLLDGTFSGF